MAEYIKREAALKICETEYQNRLRMLDYCGDTVAWNIGGEIKALPAADVAPVVHGWWLEDHDYLKCPECGVMVKWDFTFFDIGNWNYCPNCGAKMDGGAENAQDHD